MEKITLEFIPTRKIPWVGLLFLLLSLGVTGLVLSEWVNLRRENQQLSENVERLETALRKKKAEIAAERQKHDEISAAALKTYAPVLKSLNYPWNQVFSEVEEASSKDVALLSFTHDQTTAVTHLTVEVLEFPAMSQFVQRLNSAETSRWYIASYHLQSQNSPATMQGEITQNKDGNNI